MRAHEPESASKSYEIGRSGPVRRGAGRQGISDASLRATAQPQLQDSRRLVAQAHLAAMIAASPRQALQRRQFNRLFGQPPIQRAAEFRWDQKALTTFSPNAVISLNQALQDRQLMEYIPPDLLHGQVLHPGKITPIVKEIFNTATAYGTFDLSRDSDLQRLAGIIVQTHRAGQPRAGGALAGDQPAVARVGRNDFQVVEKSKADILEILALWNAYYQYKISQYDAIRTVRSDYYDQFSKLDSFKNFENVGPMIGMVLSSVRNKNQTEIHDNVRVAINPNAQDKIAAILIYTSKPTGTESSPAYVADLLANPKSIKPDRKERDYKGHKASIADPNVKGKGRVVLPDASEQRGAGNSLLQHAVLESGPEGIRLWPYDATTRGIYLGMDFDGAKFEEEADRHLLLKPKDMSKFEAHAKGSLRDAIADWRAHYV